MTVFNTANGEPLKMIDNTHPIDPIEFGLPIKANKHANVIIKPANAYRPFGFTGTLIWNEITQKIATKTPDKFGMRIVLSCRKYPYKVQIKQLVIKLMKGKEESCPTVLSRRILRAVEIELHCNPKKKRGPANLRGRLSDLCKNEELLIPSRGDSATEIANFL